MEKAQAQRFTTAKSVIEAKGVIAYPTEAVYGLGCDPFCEQAIERILDMKGREAHKGFIVIASDQSQLSPFIEPLPPHWQQKVDAVWPGPVTFVTPASRQVSPLLTGHRNSIAVRVSSHPVVQALCQHINGALVSTSANRSGQPALLNADDVRQVFGQQVDWVVEGPLGSLQSPTQIFDLTTGKQLR